ncbi:protein AHNAK2 [Lepus europaeus]|uniref:protein AHNAK2 n=1 Tax=Lepus europaeus TaxID=9983 RepID=UPI002B465D8D|nr:protein AHNAK2 [Lepus europaeus]
MSRPEEATEVTLETEAEAGASGYSVTGGGHQGIFVKQVLKDSSAAKLFNLQAGDQLLSATVFFDDIKYEDALKILQYSEPYRVQFKVRRRLSAADAKGRGSSGSQRLAAGEEKQDKDIADGCPETPTKTLEGDGDQERLISQAREGRGRRPQKERRSWPKFQALKSTRGTGPRRSHSSSEAYERRDAPDVSPSSTDTEAQAPAEHLQQKAGPGPQRTRKFLNLRLRMGLGQEQPGRGVPEQSRPREDSRGDTGAAAGDGGERGVTLAPGARPVLSTPRPTQPGLPSLAEGEGSWSEGPGVGPKPQSGAKEVETQQEARTQAEGDGEAVQSLVSGMVRGPLQGTAQGGGTQSHPPEIHVRIPHLKMPKFGFCQEKELEIDRGASSLQLAWGTSPGARGEGAREAGAGPAGQDQGEPGPAWAEPGEDQGGGKGTVRTPEGEGPVTPRGKAPPRRERERESGVTGVTARTEVTPEREGRRHRIEDEPRSVSGTDGRVAAESLALALGDRDVAPQGGELQVPSFRVSAPGMTGQALVGPRLDAAVTLPVFQGHLETRHLSTQLPSADLDVQQGQVDLKHPERQRPEAELREPQASAAGLRGHLPQVQMPSIKMPKVEPQGPQVDIKGPKVDVRGAEGDMEVSQPSMDVDIQACGGKLETDLVLGDKGLASKGSKFKMPKFKMPSFGASTPRKTVEVSVDKTMPVVEAAMTLPSLQGDLESRDLSTQLPSADLDIQSVQVDASHPEDQLPGVEVSEAQVAGTRLKGHLPKVQTPSIKMPKVGLRGPQVDIKGPNMEVKSTKGTVSTTVVEVSLPSVDADTQAPGAKVEPGLAMGDKEATMKDSKFRMPKFKMPSFGASTTRKTVQASMDAPTTTVGAAVTLPSSQGDLKTADLSLQLPSDLGVQPAQGDVRLPEAQLPDMELSAPQASAAGLRGHLPKVPSIRMPKVELQGPQVDIRAPRVDGKVSKGKVSTPDLEVSVPSVDTDVQAPGASLEVDMAVRHEDVAAKDSKFRLPRFRMPSFGTSTTSKTTEAPLDVTTPKVEADLTLPAFQGDVKTTDLSVQLPSADWEVQPVQLDGKVPEVQKPEAELPTPQASAAGPRGHLPKVPVPSIRMPKVGLKGPKVDVRAPKVDVKGSMGEVGAPDLGVSLPSVDVDMQAPDVTMEADLDLGEKAVAARDSKFRLPRVKMPSFGVPTSGKIKEASVDMTTAKVEADVALTPFQGDLKTADLSLQLPSDLGVQPAQGDVRLPEAQLPDMELSAPQASAAGLRGHLPKVPSIRMPKVELQGPQVDIEAPKVGVKGSMGEVGAPDLGVSLPSVDVDMQAPGAPLEMDLSLGDKDVTIKDGKFKLPKLKMPSFGTPTPGKTVEASVDVAAPKVEGDVTLASFHGELETTDLSIGVPSSDLGVQPAQGDARLPEAQLPDMELSVPQASAAGPRGHLPKVPSIRMPKVGLKGPKVDVRAPKVGVKGSMGDVGTPDLEVSLPSVDVDMQAPDVTMEADLDLGEKAVAARDSKFRLPRVKMPSFGVPTSGKIKEASVDMTTAKVEADVALTPFQGDLKTADLSLQLPSDLGVQPAQGDMRLPEAQLPDMELSAPQASAAGLRGHLPKVPSIRMPKVELQGPQVDIEAPKVEVKGSMGEVGAPDLGVSLPSVDVDMQAPGAPLEMDLSLGDKDVTIKDGKFKLPKLKMPSFGTPTPGKTVEASVDVAAPKVEGDVTLASFHGELETTDLSIGVPSSDLGVQPAQGDARLPEAQLPDMELSVPQASAAGPRGHLPKVPSIRMPKVELQGPQVDIRAPRVDGKVSKGKVSTPDLEVSVPSVDTDVQAPGASLEVDMAVRHEDVAAKDSKFRLPRFRMPSFGTSTTSKTTEAPLDVTTPKVEADLTLPAFQGDVKTTDLSVQLPSADWEVQPVQLDGKVPEVQKPEAELPTPQASAAGPRGHLPKVPVPSIRMPKVGLKGPKVDVRAPKVDVKGSMGEVGAPDLGVSLPSVDVDMQAPDVTMEADLDLGEKAVAARDSKFRLPRVKMPSFGVPTSGKIKEASVDMTTAKVEADVALTPFQGDLKTADLSLQLPSDLGVQPAQGDVRLPEAQLPDMELSVPQASAAGLRGHLPKVPSIRMPKVELQGPQVDIEAPKVGVKGSMGEVGAPDLGVSLPSVDVDMQAPGAPLEMDLSLGDKDVTIKDGKFKLPKLKMPSFRTPTPGKTVEASVDVAAPKVEGDVTLASFHGELETTDLSIGVPSSDLGVQPAQGDARLPEAQLPDMELSVPQASAAGPRGHLPKVPSIRMPKVELQGPQVDIKAPKVGVKGSMGEVGAPDLGVSLPSVDVDMQAPGAQLEMDRSLGHKDVTIKDSKFKMPKFKMPSFGTSTPGKTVEASLDKTVLMVEADLNLLSFQGDLRTTDLSIQLPSSDPEVQPGQMSVMLPEGPQPETELPPPQASEAGLKEHLPKVPSIKAPKVELTGSQVDIRSPSEVAECAKGEVSAPAMEVSLPCTDLGIRAPGVKGTSLGDKEVTVKDSKFRMPKFRMPSFGASTPRETVEASVDVPTTTVEAAVALPPHCGDLRSTELSRRLPSAVQPGQLCVEPPEGQLPGAERSEQPQASGLRGPLPGAQMPSIKVPRVDLKGPQVAIMGLEVDMKGAKEEVSTPDLEASLPTADVGIQAPGVKVETDLALGRLSPPPPSSSRGPVSSSSLEGSLEYIDEAPSAAGSPGAGAGDFQGSAALPEARVSVQAETQALGSAAQDSASAPGGSSERLPGPGHGPFPPVPPSALATSSVVHTAQAPGQVPQLALPSAPLASVDVTGGHVSTSREHVRLTEYQVTLPPATLAPPPPQDVAFGSQVSAPFPSLGSSAAPQCPGCVPTSQTAGLLPAAHGRVTFPKFHKPKFGFSTPKATVPEVELRAEVHAPALPAGDPTGAMGDVAEKGGPSSLPGSELRSSGVSASLETATKAPKGAPSEASDQEGKGSPFRAPGWTLPSQSRALGQDRGPTGDPEGSWEDSDAEHTDAQPKGPGSHVDTHEHRPPEVQGEKSRRGLSTAKASAGQAGVALLSPAAKGGVGAAERASSSGAKSGPSGEGAVSRRLPQARFPSLGFVRLDRRSSKATAEVSQAEARLRLPAHTATAGSGIGGPTEDGTAPPGEDLPQPPCGKPDAGLPGEDAPAGATPVSAQESWFKMPKLHVPGSRHTRSKDRGEAGEQEAPGEEGSPLSRPEVQAGAALQPPDTRAEAAKASEGVSSVGVWQCPPHSTGVTLSEISTQPAEGSLPLQGLGTRPSGRQAEALVESWPSPPQGPVRLTASRTDVPAQVSMVSTDQLWEDSVLTVQFPKLKGPRFSFPAPGSEADVFIPAVRQVRGSVAGAGEALSEGRPGLWAASILPAATEVFGEQPVCLDPSSGPPPISQVRVHFQRVPAESQDIVLRRGASPAPADPVETEAISTQIVRESEIPTSRVQTPSYGFSLLKVKIPEPRSRAACTVPGGSEEPPAGDSGAAPPDSAEPSEVVPPGGHPLGPAEDEEPGGHPLEPAEDEEPGGHPLEPAEDEEPAQVLEFPAEEGRAAAGTGAAPQRPGGQKSGLWFWLPHIGFSSSAGEASAASKDLSPRPAPVQTQPEAGPAAHLLGRQEKASWFRFPKLGFSAPPAKSGPGVEGGAGPSEPTSQDETVAFFDARESLSPEEKEGADAAEAAGAGQKELTKNAGREPAPPTQRGPEKGEA